MKIAEFMKPENWTQRVMALDNESEEVDARDPRAVEWCLLGYVEKCYDDEEFDGVAKKLQDAAGILYGPREAGYILSLFNDTHTFEYVKALVTEAGV